MTGTAVAALPTTGDSSRWSETEKALVEAAGLVTGAGANRRLAPRPVVEAFLLHARRTGLDPIARQIYCIERGGKWGTQVSIDGARLVAERTGQYRGQTPTQWTADGREWVDVWLPKEPPAAARVGVYREGFAEALFAVATFDAYNAGSPIWKKMPALMLGKCAEMLALRKAFPQDLSGLYSTEEMDQAGAPREVVREAERPARAAVASAPVQAADEVTGEVVAARDWAAQAAATNDLASLTALANEAQQAGELGLRIGLAGDNDDGSAHTVMDVLKARKAELEQPVQQPMVDVPAQRPRTRQWVREARAMRSRAEVRALFMEAKAAGAQEGVLDELGAIEGSLPEEKVSAPVMAWATAEPGESEWVEGPNGEYVERPAAES